MISAMDKLIFCLTILEIYSFSLAEKENGFHDRKLHVKDFSSSKRTERALFTGIKRIIEGKQATKKLLKGTIQIPTSMTTIENYLKRGNQRTAIDDFFSVKPSNVQDFVMPGRVKGKVGTVGNLEIKVQTWVDHGATSIIITKGLGTKKQMSKYIAYQMEQMTWPFGQKCTTCSN